MTIHPLFHGSALVDVDVEGNAATPAFVREAMAQAAELLVSKHEADDCLVGFGTAQLQELASRNERRRLGDEARGEDPGNHYRRMRRTFGLMDRMPRCESRLRIPPAMRRLGRIGTLALFVGAGDSFEIWNPELALEYGDAQFRDLAAFQLDMRGHGAAPHGVN